MNELEKAARLALEVLVECRRDPRLKYEHPHYDSIITALRRALEQPTCKQPLQVEQPIIKDYLEKDNSKLWVGLTIQEIEAEWDLFMSCAGSGYVPDFVSAIEAKLREKNGG